MNRENISDKLLVLTNFNLNLLTVFCLVYSTKSITDVSEMLGVTPSSVSQSLQKLRLHFHDPLFIRHGNSISPTSFSDDLFMQVKDLIEQIGDSVNHPGKMNKREELKIYSPFSLVLDDLPSVLNDIKNIKLPYKIKYIETNIYLPDADELLNLRKVDVVFSASPIINSALKCIEYDETDFTLACRNQNPYHEKNITAERLEEIDLVGYINSDIHIKQIQKIAKENMGEQHIVFETNSLLAQLTVLSNTDFFGFIPNKAFQILGAFFNLRKVEPLFPVPKIQIYMTYRKEMDNSKEFRIFLQSILKKSDDR